MNEDKPYHGMMKRFYCSKKRDEKRRKKLGSVPPRGLIKTRTFIAVVDFSGMIHRLGLASWNINIVWPSVQLVGVFDSIPHFSLPVEIVFVLVFFLLY